MADDFRDFSTILRDLDGGSVNEEATHQLRLVVRAARVAGKKGTLTIKLDVEPDGRQFVISAKVDAKCPVPAPGITMFFADDDGDLQRSDPRQEPLRGIDPRPAQPLRTLSTLDSPKGA